MENLLDKLRYLNDCLQNGKSLMDPAVWGDRANRIGTLQHLLVAAVALVAAFGYKLDASPTDLSALAVGISVVVNLLSQASALIHTASNKELGRTVPRDLDPVAADRRMFTGLVAVLLVNAAIVGAAAWYISSVV